MRAVCQVSIDERTPPALPEAETLEDIIRRLLPKPALPPPQGGPDTIGPGSPHSAIAGNGVPTGAGGHRIDRQ